MALLNTATLNPFDQRHKKKIKPKQFDVANAKKIQANQPASLCLSGVQDKDRHRIINGPLEVASACIVRRQDIEFVPVVFVVS